MPYLTRSHKEFKSHRIFRPFYNRFYVKININHALFWFSQGSYMQKKAFRLYWRSSKVMFKKISQNLVKSPLKFCLISDFSPQLMACMHKDKQKRKIINQRNDFLITISSNCALRKHTYSNKYLQILNIFR